MRNHTKLASLAKPLIKSFSKSFTKSTLTKSRLSNRANTTNHTNPAKPAKATPPANSKKSTKIKSSNTKKAFGLIYAAIFLAIVGLFLANARLSTSLSLDRITNSHIHFQSALYLRSLEDIARLCASKPDFTQGRFDFGGGYIGGFSLQHSESKTKAYLYVEGKNLRTGQILRATKEIYLPQNEPNNQNPLPSQPPNKENPYKDISSKSKD